MRPDFGCRIWDWLMEPLTDFMRDQIVAEAIRVCQYDTRVQVDNVDVGEMEHGLQISLTLTYIPLGVIDNFRVDFESNETSDYNVSG
jgi:phage baseplate assembly protein W